MNYQILLPALAGCLVAFCAVNWIYFRILKIALHKKLVDNPDARKLQKMPIPVLGGIAVYFGVLAGVLSGVVVYNWVTVPVYTSFVAVICAMSIMLYVGALDDILGLTPSARIIIEVLVVLALVFSSGMCIDTFHGMWGVNSYSWLIAVPLTVFAGVGIINAINMVDGINGLSSGLCMCYCVFFGIYFIKVGHVANTVLAFCMIGALLPFFIHNVFGLKSRMFVGDSGTMTMGILMTWFLINALSSKSAVISFSNGSGVNMIALALAILSVPVFDTLRVMTMRMLKGRSPFSPDKTHLHHVFVNVGMSHFITAMSEILIDVLIVAVWLVGALCGLSMEWQLYLVILSSVILVWGTYGILRFHVRRHTGFLFRLTKFSIRTHLGRTVWWKRITEWLDAPGDYDENDDSRPVRDRTKLDIHIDEIDIATERGAARKCILEYLKGKAEVHLEDIIANSGADEVHVYPVIAEETREGYVEVLNEDPSGLPLSVALVEE